MKRPILKGPKLIAVGPLKCFKSTGSNSSGSTGSSSSSSSKPRTVVVRDPVYGTPITVSASDAKTAVRTGAVRGGDSASAYRRQGEIGAAYASGMLNQPGRASDFVQEAARLKKEEDDKRKLMTDDPQAFNRLLMMGDEIAEGIASEEENKKEEQAKKDIIANKKIKNLLKTALPNIALDVVGLGAVNLATALASEVLSPEKKAEIVKSLEDNVPGVKAVKEAFAQETETASDAEVQAALDSGEYDNPDNPNVYSGSPRTKQAQKESKGGDKFTPPLIPNVQVAKTVVEEKAEEEPKTPAAMSEADLTAMLEKRARGEDSLVEREAKMARERGLAQQLAAVRGARGATAGQRLRALRRGSETTEREIQPQVAAAKAREQQAAQDALLGLKTGDRRRAEDFAQQEKIAKLKQSKGGGGGGARPKDQGFLGKLKTGLGLFKGAKKLFGFEEGGFVSGPGTETSDSIPAKLSDGEFVIKASAVRGIGKAMGAKDEGEQRTKGVDFLYKLQDRMDKVEKFAEGGEAYSRPKKAFREAIGHESESRFHDKAFKDTKHGGARRKFRHFQDGGPVDMKGPGMVKEQFKMPSAGGFGSVVAAQGDLQRRIEELERKMGK